MALKDWKRISSSEWEKKGNILRILKLKNPISGTSYEVTINNYPISSKLRKSNKILKGERFKTKKRALKVAKAYMRKH